ncbi:MAG TPA: hypothetical protein VNW54_11530, partial [Granulicella sp.]|nr:hypothetical protein [Granulicella sp.]
MNAGAVVALLPLLTIATTAVVVMLAIAIRRNHKVAAAISLIGIAVALGSLALAASAGPRQVATLFVLDGYARLYMGLLLGAAGFA